jgi:hypothetical protein
MVGEMEALENWRRHCFFTPSLVRVSFLSHSWLLPNLTGLNWGADWRFQIRHRIDRQCGQLC